MAKAVTVKVEGLKELEEALLNKAPKAVRKATRSVMRDAGKWMAAQIAAAAPHRSGFLASHIVSKIKISTKQDEATVAVGPSKDAFYAQFEEFGSVHNKPPNPFIRRTFEKYSQAWLEFVVVKVRAVLGWN
jgi:HK97 gp10 family phage protein